MARSRRASVDAVLVVGLGRFGGAVAGQLAELGIDVLAVESDPVVLQQWSERLTHVVQADATDPEALRQLGAGEFSRAVVGIGGLEASILCVTALVDLGVPDVWAKALTTAHGRILERVGASRVVFPEHEMGERVAHQVTGRLLDFLEVHGGYAVAEVRVTEALAGRTLRDTGLRSKERVSVLAVSAAGAGFEVAVADTRLAAGDLLVVAGARQDVERFAERYC